MVAAAGPAPIPALAPELKEDVEAEVLLLTADDDVLTVFVAGRSLVDVGEGEIEEVVEDPDEEVLKDTDEEVAGEDIE